MGSGGSVAKGREPSASRPAMSLLDPTRPAPRPSAPLEMFPSACTALRPAFTLRVAGRAEKSAIVAPLGALLGSPAHATRARQGVGGNMLDPHSSSHQPWHHPAPPPSGHP